MMVLGFIAEARQVPLPVTRSSIEAFGAAAKKKLLAAAATTAAEKNKLETFTASTKWVKNFVSRNGMSSMSYERDEHLLPPLVERSAVRPRVGLGEVLDRARRFAEAARVLGFTDDRHRDLASPGRVGAHVG